MRITIAGAGAIGSVIAAYLIAAGKHPISILARGETLEAIRRNELIVESSGRRYASRPHASDDAKELGPQDVVIVAAKGYSIAGIAPALTPMIGPETLIVTAQNGIPWWYFYALDSFGIKAPETDTPFETVDPHGTIWKKLGPEHAVGCIVNLPAEKVAPGVVRHGGNGVRITIGAPKKGDHAEAMAAFAAACKDSGIDCAISDDIRLTTWAKLQSQVSSSMIGVLTGGNIRQVESAPGIAAVKARASAEAIAVANAWGTPLKPEPNRQSSVTGSDHKSSIVQDFEAGRPLELDAMAGAVIDLGKRRNVAVPTIEMLYALTKLRAETRN